MRWRTSRAKQSTICCMSIFVMFEFKVAESKERYIYLILSSSSLISSLLPLWGKASCGCSNFYIKRCSNLFASFVWQICPEAWDLKSWMMEISSRAPALEWVIDFLRCLRPGMEWSLTILGGLFGNSSWCWLGRCKWTEFLFLMRNLEVVF